MVYDSRRAELDRRRDVDVLRRAVELGIGKDVRLYPYSTSYETIYNEALRIVDQEKRPRAAQRAVPCTTSAAVGLLGKYLYELRKESGKDLEPTEVQALLNDVAKQCNCPHYATGEPPPDWSAIHAARVAEERARVANTPKKYVEPVSTAPHPDDVDACLRMLWVLANEQEIRVRCLRVEAMHARPLDVYEVKTDLRLAEERLRSLQTMREVFGEIGKWYNADQAGRPTAPAMLRSSEDDWGPLRNLFKAKDWKAIGGPSPGGPPPLKR